ncbi:ASCH domain-containing protein [Aliarcobacter butzleri]|uniref:ASCH domain-containing protein n=1 Tax=Aliarcobacter butzleri TaxID=28197 RepID=UPI00344C2997
MKCLTIKQPWAWLIFNDGGINKGLKNIENRNWHTNIRGTIAIHTSKKIDIEVYNGLIKYSGFKLPPLNELECGKIIGVVDIVDSVEKHSSYWKEYDSIGFVLENSKKLVSPIPLKGQLGFFNLSEDVLKEMKIMSTYVP